MCRYLVCLGCFAWSLLATHGFGPASSSCLAETCCAVCGCRDNCRTVCRLVCEEKKLTATCWGSQAEEFCVPGPSHRGCQHREQLCPAGADGGGWWLSFQQRSFVWNEWIPGCATIHTRHKLMKKTVTTTISSHKWIVETRCAKCASEVATALPLQ